MAAPLKIGERVPPIELARILGGSIERMNMERLLAGRRAIMVGVPGAFTPICTQTHIPEFVREADRLRDFGFHLVICIAPNDPWVLKAWAEQVDPEGRVMFLSDGNLELARALGVVVIDKQHFFGERSHRYLLVTRHAVIENLSVEVNPMTVSCTSASTVLIDD